MTPRGGLFPNAIKNDEELHDIVAFFGWTAWASAADRPDQPYSTTNNWPSEPNVDNKPTADLMVWSALSLIALIGGTGLMFAIYGRWSRAIGWHAEEAPVLDFRQPDEVRLTPLAEGSLPALRNDPGAVPAAGSGGCAHRALP